MRDFSDKILNWFASNGRKDLPWQQDLSAYRVWISEIMLQQTQVATVIPYFNRFMESFPDINSLASAGIDQVLHHWTGLGYYARARNLHKTARLVVDQHGGQLPQSVEQLCELPGIGESTAGAIAAIAYKRQAAILDGNVKRVLTRFHGIGGWPEQSQVKKKLWQLARAQTPAQGVAEYTQAIMDLGATVCTRSSPACNACPLASHCQAYKTESIALYPGRKPKKSLPVKQVTMFILQNSKGEVLLEKRPPSGIWGGLWSFPEAPNTEALPEVIANSVNAGATSSWPEIRHTFSHFHLDITPVHEKVESIQDTIMDSERWLWYPLHNPAQVGLAAPVKKLLSRLMSASS